MLDLGYKDECNDPFPREVYILVGMESDTRIGIGLPWRFAILVPVHCNKVTIVVAPVAPIQSLAQELVHVAGKAKKQTNKQTETMLGKPDS